MLLAIYSQCVVSDPFERIGPTMVFSFMLIGRLVIYYQVSEPPPHITYLGIYYFISTFQIIIISHNFLAISDCWKGILFMVFKVLITIG